MAIVSGVLGVDVGGTSYATEESAEYSTQTREYTEINVGTGYGGVEGKGTSPFIEVDIRLGEGQSLDALKVKGETIILRCEDRTITLTQGRQVGKLSNAAAKNAVKVRFVGPKCTEVF